MNVLVWFDRDLRVADHPALARAAGLGQVLPLYVVEPELWQAPDRAARHWDFTAECLAELRDATGALGAPLVVRTGPAAAVLPALCRRHGIGLILRHRRAGAATPAAAAWARAAGIGWEELDESDGAPLPAPAVLNPVPEVEPGPIPAARALRLAEDRCPHRQLGGRSRAMGRLEALGGRGGARLSPYLAAGVLSLAEARAAAAEARGPAAAGLRAGLARRARAVAAGAAAPAGPQAGAGPLAAWAAGETGLPLVDAAMRSLAATGWLDARLRALVAAAATGLLGIAPAAAGLLLARRFTDYDPAIHWPLAGTPGRADPARLAARIDPDGRFTRAWLPELAEVPDALLQTPWRWAGAPRLLGRRYPEPLADPGPAPRPLPRPPARPARPATQLCLDL